MTVTSASKINLIPWDYQSEAHIERMVAQRKVCGWGANEVRSWAERAETGLKTMFWVELAETIPNREEMLESHRKKYPAASAPLENTATTNSHQLLPTQSGNATAEFIPVAHVALNKNPTPDLKGSFESLLPEEGVYWVANLWVSEVLQGSGIGRAVMSEVEAMSSRKREKIRPREKGRAQRLRLRSWLSTRCLPTGSAASGRMSCFISLLGLELPRSRIKSGMSGRATRSSRSCRNIDILSTTARLSIYILFCLKKPLLK
ncbi:hypothetical protein F5Y16DRAFT_377144 [Xylariaceae sp. FL0255]|nr:hypothetical protein F5Y16DRAFT_377144 [Xylariaceae sp. FL0255]